METYDLSNYEQLLKELNLLREAKNQNLKDHSIKGLTFNSKDVIPGTLFICKGQNFKEIYLQEAVKRGAIAYVSEKERSEEHTSELQSRFDLVCRLLLEKKKKNIAIS